LDDYFGLDVKVITYKTRKLAGNERSRGVPRDLFEFKVLVTQEVRALLEAGRKQDAALLREKVRQARLDAINLQRRQLSTKNGEALKQAESDI
jgi:hypothetical protein